MRIRRVAEMERRLDGLLALVSSTQACKDKDRDGKEEKQKETDELLPQQPPIPSQIEPSPPVAFGDPFATNTTTRLSAHAFKGFPQQHTMPYLVFDDKLTF